MSVNMLSAKYSDDLVIMVTCIQPSNRFMVNVVLSATTKHSTISHLTVHLCTKQSHDDLPSHSPPVYKTVSN